MLEEIRERSPATGSTNGCRLPSRCWEITPGPLEEQPALLPLSHLSSPLVFNSVLEALISKTPKQPDKHGDSKSLQWVSNLSCFPEWLTIIINTSVGHSVENETKKQLWGKGDGPVNFLAQQRHPQINTLKMNSPCRAEFIKIPLWNKVTFVMSGKKEQLVHWSLPLSLSFQLEMYTIFTDFGK